MTRQSDTSWTSPGLDPLGIRTAGRPMPRSVLPFFVVGLHLGVLQTALFFVLQVQVTATFMGYFAVVMAWMGGIILNLRWGRPRSVEGALIVSAGAYLLALGLGRVPGPLALQLALHVALATVVALPAGAFFREYSSSTSSRSLFLHENNGFILGLLLGMIGFVQWGVSFLTVAPVVTTLMALAAISARAWVALALIGVGALWARSFGGTQVYWVLIAALVGAVASSFLRPRAADARGEGPDFTSTTGGGRSTFRATRVPKGRWLDRHGLRLMLALAGCNLVMLQYFITREFATVLAASELTILLVGIAYFSGYSVGYGLAGILSPRYLRLAAALTFPMHLGMLLFSRVIAGHLIMGGLGVWALVALLFCASFFAASLYSVLLPKLIDEGGLSLVEGYSVDLMGAVLGTLAVLLLTFAAPQALWPLYFGLLTALLFLLFRKTAWSGPVLLVGCLAVALVTIFQGRVHTLATEDYYRTRGYENPSVVFSGNSFYHSIDVLDTFEDEAQSQAESRVSFINGVRYFRFYMEDGRFSSESRLSEFSYFLAGLPAHYLKTKLERPLRVLIMGAGSMYSIRRVAPFAEHTTMVEIDPMVVEAARAGWQELNQLDRIDNYEIVFDDVLHFLANTDQEYDLIINDISAPYYLGTMILHSREFYGLVAQRLSPEGLFAEACQGRPRPSKLSATPIKILRGVADVFDRYRLVETRRGARAGDQSFVYASQDLDLRTEDVTAVMRADDMYRGTSTYWEGSSRFRLHRVEPFSLRNLETLLTANLRRIENRIGRDEEDPSLSVGTVLGRMLDPQDPRHSRLLVWCLGGLRSPWGWGPLLALALLAFMLSKRARARSGVPVAACRSGIDALVEDQDRAGSFHRTGPRKGDHESRRAA